MPESNHLEALIQNDIWHHTSAFSSLFVDLIFWDIHQSSLRCPGHSLITFYAHIPSCLLHVGGQFASNSLWSWSLWPRNPCALSANCLCFAFKCIDSLCDIVLPLYQLPIVLLLSSRALCLTWGQRAAWWLKWEQARLGGLYRCLSSKVGLAVGRVRRFKRPQHDAKKYKF